MTKAPWQTTVFRNKVTVGQLYVYGWIRDGDCFGRKGQQCTVEIIGAKNMGQLHTLRMGLPHETRPVQVWVDVDLGIADVVVYLNTIPGVRTHASCQGTVGEGGPHPYRAQVMVSWETQRALERLKREFDVEIPEDCNGNWFYVHPRELKV